MDRLMVLQLETRGCVAEAWLNGVALARVVPGQPPASVAVHEYALVGANRLELRVAPPPLPEEGAPAQPPAPLVAESALAASARLLLPRANAPVDAATARGLAQCDFMLPAGETVEPPVVRSVEVNLPLAFPRWRWLDAPPVNLARAPVGQAHAFVQRLALDLTRGQVDGFLAATRLRTIEVAQAYQRDAEAEKSRLRTALLEGYADKRLKWTSPEAKDFRLRPLAGGRLMECLDADGEPALRSEPDDQGACRRLPLRLAWVEGQIYVLR